MINELLIDRTHALGYLLTEKEENNQGWIGGNAPEWFADRGALLVDEDGNQYGFFLTMKLPLTDDMVSIFLPERFAVYAHGTYPCGIKAVMHPISSESKEELYRLMPEKPEPGQRLTKYQKRFDYSLPVLTKAFIGPWTKSAADSRPFEDFIQFGGIPAWIQGNKKYYTNQLLDDGYVYIMQINEDQYLPDLIHGNYPFCFGALYLYGKLKGDRLTDLIAAFWQNS